MKRKNECIDNNNFVNLDINPSNYTQDQSSLKNHVKFLPHSFSTKNNLPNLSVDQEPRSFCFDDKLDNDAQ